MHISETTMAHSKYLKFLFSGDNDSISAKYAGRIYPLYLAHTFIFKNFLIALLCKSLASRSFKLTSVPNNRLIDHTF